MSAKTLSAAWACTRFAKRTNRVKGVRKTVAKRRASSKIRRHGRTAFHAFASEAPQGTRANFRALHDQFRSLPPHERSRFERMAEGTHTAPKQGKHTKQRPFGLTRYEVSARVQQRHRRAQWERLQRGCSEEERLESLCRDITIGKVTSEHAIGQAVQEWLWQQKQQREESVVAAEELAQWEKSQRGVIDATVAELGLAQGTRPEDFQCSPCSSGIALEYAPDSAATAALVLSFMRKSRGSNLGAALELDWQRKTRIIGDAGLATIPDKTKKERDADQCRLAGVCLCSAEGKVLKRFGVALLNIGLKPFSKPYSVGRRLLSQGFLVVALASLPRPPKGTKLDDLVPPDVVEDPRCATWKHIGLMYFKPWRPTFQCLAPVGLASAVPGVVHLRALGDVGSLYPSIEDLDVGRVWWARLFQMPEPLRPLAKITPTTWWQGPCTHRSAFGPLLASARQEARPLRLLREMRRWTTTSRA